MFATGSSRRVLTCLVFPLQAVVGVRPVLKEEAGAPQHAAGRAFMVTWNEGGGAPTPEFLGGDWMDVQVYDETEKAFGKIMLTEAGFTTEELNRYQAQGYQYQRYTSGTVLPHASTVDELLSGFETNAKAQGIDISRYPCWKGLSMASVMAYGLKKSKTLLSAGCLGTGDADVAYLGSMSNKNLFAGPDGCFKNRKTQFARAAWIDLLNSEDDETYWRKWFDGLTSVEWGPQRFCKVARGGVSIGDYIKTPTNINIGDIIPTAIFDKLLVATTRSVLANQATKVTVPALTFMTKNDVKATIQKMNGWICGRTDLVMLQEATPNVASACSDHDEAHIGDGDAAVLVKKSMGIDRSATDAVAKLVAKYTAQYIDNPPSHNRRDASFSSADCNSFYSKSEKIAVAVINTPRTIVVTCHSDSAGMFAGEVIEMATQLRDDLEAQDSSGAPYALIVGMDTNAQPGNAETGAWNVPSIVKLAHDLKLSIVQPDHYTVYKARSFIQAQITKAAKTDRIKKDFIFFSPANRAQTADVDGTLVNHLALASGGQPTGDGTFTDRGAFPTDVFPVDHFMLFAPPTP